MDILDRDSLSLSMGKAGDYGLDSETSAQKEAAGSTAEKALNPAFVEAMGQGRKKGQVNRLTRTMKEAIEQAFEKAGGVDYLVRLANGTSSDRQAFAALIGRLLPMQVNSNIEARIRVELPWLASRGIGKVDPEGVHALQLVGKGRTIDSEAPEGQGAAGGIDAE